MPAERTAASEQNAIPDRSIKAFIRCKHRIRRTKGGKQPEQAVNSIKSDNDLSVGTIQQDVRHSTHDQILIRIVIDAHQGVIVIAELEIEATIAPKINNRRGGEQINETGRIIDEVDRISLGVTLFEQCLIAICAFPSRDKGKHKLHP